MPQRVSESHPLKLPIDSIELDYSRSRILHACEPQIELDFGNSPANIWPQPLPPLATPYFLALRELKFGVLAMKGPSVEVDV
jgi:hypothetical protein